MSTPSIGRSILSFFVGAALTAAVCFAILVVGFVDANMQPPPPEWLKSSIEFDFDPAGAGLMRELSRKNLPTEKDDDLIKRHLAIVLDGEVLSQPTINSEISRSGQIYGHFTDKEVDDMLELVQSGSRGGAMLRQPPVNERRILDPHAPGRDNVVIAYDASYRRKGETRGATVEERDVLIEELKRLLQKEGIRDSEVLRDDEGRIEIRLPLKKNDGNGLTSEEIKSIKRRLSQVGLVEFRILANEVDDRKALDDVMRLFASGEPEFVTALQEAQRRGMPPPVPRTQGLDGEVKIYDIGRKETKSRVTYRWIALGPTEIQTLSLDNRARDIRDIDWRWREAAFARDGDRATQLSDHPGSARRILQGALFFSRECKDSNVPEAERTKWPIEYFVLARNPEIDPATEREGPVLDGTYFLSVKKRSPNDPDMERRKLIEFVGLGAATVIGFALLFVRRWLRLPWAFLGGVVAVLVVAAVYIAAE